MHLQLQLILEVVQRPVYVALRQVYVSQQKNVRYQELFVVSHKQEHECAATKVVCAMSSGMYQCLNIFDHSRLARRMANFDTHYGRFVISAPARFLLLFDLASEMRT